MGKLTTSAKASYWLNDLVRRNPFYFHYFMSTYKRLVNSSDDKVEEFHTPCLIRALKRASHSGYGQAQGGSLDIRDWPLLEKQQLRQYPENFQIGFPWFGIEAATGGTSGIPLRMRRSLSGIVAEQAGMDFLADLAGVDLRRARVAVLRGESIKDPSDRRPPFSKIVANGQRLMLSSHHLSAEAIQHYVDDIVAFSPDCLLAYPSSVEALCKHIRDRGCKVSIPLVICSSEMLLPATWQAIEATLSARVIDRYGLAERTSFAYASKPGQYYFLSGYGYVELLPVRRDDKFQYCEIVGTPFWNTGMAFVRYRTGDLVLVDAGYDDAALKRVCLGKMPFIGIEGRASDYLLAPDGARLIAMNHLPREVEHISQMQILQESLTSVVIRVIPEQGFGSNDLAMIEANARQKLPGKMAVRIEVTHELERTAAGKTPFIIRRLESNNESSTLI